MGGPWWDGPQQPSIRSVRTARKTLPRSHVTGDPGRVPNRRPPGAEARGLISDSSRSWRGWWALALGPANALVC